MLTIDGTEPSNVILMSYIKSSTSISVRTLSSVRNKRHEVISAFNNKMPFS